MRRIVWIILAALVAATLFVGDASAALCVQDRVRDSSSTTGTGAFTLANSPPVTYQSFSTACAVNDTFYYAIVNLSGPNEWEIGVGTLTASTTLTRTTVLAGSNGTSAVNFTGGFKDVYISQNAEKAAQTADLTTPIIYGGTAAAGSLTLSTTSNATPSGDFIYFNSGLTTIAQMCNSSAVYGLTLGVANGGTAGTCPGGGVTLTMFNNTGNGQMVFRYDDVGAGMLINQASSAGYVTVNNQANAALVLAANNAEALAIYPSGGLVLSNNPRAGSDPGSGGMRLEGASITFTALATDATHTDRTVCQDATSKSLFFGSGTVGICLGTSGTQFKNLVGMTGPTLDRISRLPIRDYYYKPGYGDDGANLQRGPTAQDVEAVFPDLVRHNEQGEAINYDWGALVFLQLRAIQELKADNDNLREQIRELRRVVR